MPEKVVKKPEKP